MMQKQQPQNDLVKKRDQGVVLYLMWNGEGKEGK